MDVSLYRYGRKLNTHDLLKIIATLLMVVDHIGIVTHNQTLRLIGRGSAPIFYFLIGYNGKLHLNPLIFIYGLVLSYSWTVISGGIWINILLTFIMIHYAFKIIKPEAQSLASRIVGFVFLVAVSYYIYPFFEYGLLGLLLGLAARSLALSERGASVWIFASLFVFIAFQGVFLSLFNSVGQIIGLVAIFFGLFLLLFRYQLRTIDCPPFVRVPAMLISRYSLHIYFFHWLFLQWAFIAQ